MITESLRYRKTLELCAATVTDALRDLDNPGGSRLRGDARRSELLGRLAFYAGLDWMDDRSDWLNLPEFARILSNGGKRQLSELFDEFRKRALEAPIGKELSLSDTVDWDRLAKVIATQDVSLRESGGQIEVTVGGVEPFGGVYTLTDGLPTVASPSLTNTFGTVSIDDVVGSMWLGQSPEDRMLNVSDYLGTAARRALQELYSNRREEEEITESQFRGAIVDLVVFGLAALAVLFGVISIGFGAASPAPGSPAFWVSTVAGVLAALFGFLACAAATPTCWIVVTVPASKCGEICA